MQMKMMGRYVDQMKRGERQRILRMFEENK